MMRRMLCDSCAGAGFVGHEWGLWLASGALAEESIVVRKHLQGDQMIRLAPLPSNLSRDCRR